jgi:hypothetical protein
MATTTSTKVFYPKNAVEAAIYLNEFHGQRLNISCISKFIDSPFEFNDVYAYSTTGQKHFNIKKYRGRKWVSGLGLDSIFMIALSK